MAQIMRLHILNDNIVSIRQRNALLCIKPPELASFEWFNSKCEEQLGITYDRPTDEVWRALVQEARAAK